MAKLENIYNFCKVSDTLGTAGQPLVEEFPAIKDAGYEVVINLADGTSSKTVADEPQIVADLGLEYHNIPVAWNNPTQADLEQFFALMAAKQDKKIFLHCIANYRVSAFTMLYRVIKQGVPLAEAKAFKDTIWKPEDVVPIWDEFIAASLKKYGVEG